MRSLGLAVNLSGHVDTTAGNMKYTSHDSVIEAGESNIILFI